MTADYASIRSAIAFMRDSDLHECSVNEAAADRALRLVDVFEHLSFTPPKLFACDDDTVVFTWDTPKGKLSFAAVEDHVRLTIGEVTLAGPSPEDAK